MACETGSSPTRKPSSSSVTSRSWVGRRPRDHVGRRDKRSMQRGRSTRARPQVSAAAVGSPAGPPRHDRSGDVSRPGTMARPGCPSLDGSIADGGDSKRARRYRQLLLPPPVWRAARGRDARAARDLAARPRTRPGACPVPGRGRRVPRDLLPARPGVARRASARRRTGPGRLLMGTSLARGRVPRARWRPDTGRRRSPRALDRARRRDWVTR